MKFVFAALVVAMLIAPAQADTGTLAYPSESNLNSREGTLEFWMASPVDVKARFPSSEYDGVLSMALLQAQTGGVSLIWFAGAMYRPEAGMSVSMHSTRTELHGTAFGRFVPAPMEWHHLAITWRADTLTAYLDGQKMNEIRNAEQMGIALGSFGEHPLLIGDKWHRNGAMVIDEMRVSSICRPPQELGFHGRLEIDPWTRILDRFDEDFTPDGVQKTKPAVIYFGDGGLPTAHCRFVPGRFGNGLALFQGK